MIKVSCYQTTQNQLPKSLCQLVEKCYYSDLRTILFMENKNYRDEIDRVLWTYSKKHFIPHATSDDPLPERQPVYITEDTSQYNKSEIIVFVKATRDNVLKAFADKNITGSKTIQKIFFVFDEGDQMNARQLQDLLAKSSFKNIEVKSFSQTAAGAWQEASF